MEFSAEEFETALITPNDTLGDIHMPLLKVGDFVVIQLLLMQFELLHTQVWCCIHLVFDGSYLTLVLFGVVATPYTKCNGFLYL